MTFENTPQNCTNCMNIRVYSQWVSIFFKDKQVQQRQLNLAFARISTLYILKRGSVARRTTLYFFFCLVYWVPFINAYLRYICV